MVFSGLLSVDRTQMETESPQFIRKHWSFVIGYILVASVAVGFGLAGIIFLYSIIRGTSHTPNNALLHIWLIIAGGASAVVFVIQLFAGPLVFTKDVVCQVCHRQQKLARIPFFQGKYYTQPKCECGGDLEPALFWKLES